MKMLTLVKYRVGNMAISYISYIIFYTFLHI